MKRIILSLLLLILITGCKKAPDADPDPNNMHIGYWHDPQISDSVWTYRRACTLPIDNYGFVVVRGGLFIERKNAGSCGTSPITDYEGNWELSGNILVINTKYWGGSEQYRWRVKHCDNKVLSVVKLQ